MMPPSLSGQRGDRALCAVSEKLGPLHAVIAHSMGSPILAEALHAGMSAARIVMISAPANYEHYARGFAAAAGLDADGAEAMLTRLGDPTSPTIN